jgi:hypothetical protein
VVDVGGTVEVVVVVVVDVVVAHADVQGAVHLAPENAIGGTARQSQPVLVVQASLGPEVSSRY